MRRQRWGGFLGALLLAAALVPADVSAAATKGAVPNPTVTVPPSGIRSHPLWDSWYDLAPFGYEEYEFFASGTAHDAAGSSAPYTTRIIVTRPSRAKAFNGTAVLDWTNVTAQFENAVDTMEARQMLMREGFMYVHVSAQAAGVCCSPLTPKVWDPVRYAALNHPGDQFANDMFSQVAKAIRSPRRGPAHPAGGLKVQRVLAAGQSQSCGTLKDYVATTQAAARVIDGFLLHGCAAGEKGFSKPLTTKVLHLLSDNEADPSPPSKDPRYRLWEVAGTAHSDYFIGYQSVVGQGPRTVADAPQSTRAEYETVLTAAGNYGEQLHPLLAACVVAGSTMPMHYATSSAIFQLDRWVRATGHGATAAAPKNSPRFEFDGTALRLDQFGNTVGGIRLPPIDVPVARYLSTACPLGGITVPFTDAQIQALYPTHDRYYALMNTATNRAVGRGWLLGVDAADLLRRACAAKSRWAGSSGTGCD